MCRGLSIDDVGVSRDTVFQEIRQGAGFETGDFVKETLGGLPSNESFFNGAFQDCSKSGFLANECNVS